MISILFTNYGFSVAKMYRWRGNHHLTKMDMWFYFFVCIYFLRNSLKEKLKRSLLKTKSDSRNCSLFCEALGEEIIHLV